MLLQFACAIAGSRASNMARASRLLRCSHRQEVVALLYKRWIVIILSLFAPGSTGSGATVFYLPSEAVASYSTCESDGWRVNYAG